VFLTRPISAALLVVAALIVASPLLKLRKPKALVADPET
jgi:putative tricarboxylic transport membrane protein